MLTPEREDSGGAARTGRQEQLRRLTDVSRALTYASDIDEVLQLAVQRGMELLDGTRSVLMLADDEGGLHVRAAHGVNAALMEKFRAPLSESLVHRLQRLLGEGGAVVAVPLVVRGLVTGLLAVQLPPGKSAGLDGEWLLSALADQAAVALDHSRLDDEARASREQIERQHSAVTTLAHDVRGPAAAVSLSIEMLLRGIWGPLTDRQREALGRIRGTVTHLEQVVKNALEMASLSSEKVEIPTRPSSARRVAEEAVRIVHAEAEAAGQDLALEHGPDLVVRADPERLRQVLVNLLHNAVHYCPRGATVRVRGGVQKRHGVSWGALAVSDDGPGVAAEEREAIFQPYRRGKAGARRGGTGLGLAISRELMRRMNGDIVLDSELGRGATFTVLVPLGQERT